MRKRSSTWPVRRLWLLLPLSSGLLAGNPNLLCAEVERKVPDVPEAPVLELAFVKTDARGADAQPVAAVAVYADGKVLVPDPNGSAQSLRGQLSRDELQALLNDVVETHGVFDCETEALSRALETASRESGLAWRVPSADTTVIRVRCRGRQHEVRCPAAELLEERFPGVEGLPQLCLVQRRLQNIRSVVLVGGPEEAERLAGLARQELRKQGIDGPTLASSDLQQVLGSADGCRYVQFHRRERELPQQGESGWLVSIVETPDEPPRVSVTRVPQVRR